MSLLHPAVESIERGYAAWLRPLESTGDIDAESLPPVADPGVDRTDSSLSLPDAVADAVRRQVDSRPARRVPTPGDVIVIPAPVPADATIAEPQHPVAVLLDQKTDEGWSGWLVGAHVDYAGNQDLVLESNLIESGADPAPLAGMVLCWDRVALDLPGQALVLHHLTESALTAARALERCEPTNDIPPSPGRMATREIDGTIVVTGTPYLDTDPRAAYLRLARELARRVSEPQYDDQGRLRRPDRDAPER